MCHPSPCCFKGFEQVPLYILDHLRHAAPGPLRHEADEEMSTVTTH